MRVLSRDLERDRASLDAFAPGRRRRLARATRLWERVGAPLPGRAARRRSRRCARGARLRGRSAARAAARFARFGVLPVRRFARGALPRRGRRAAARRQRAARRPRPGVARRRALRLGARAGSASSVGLPVPEGGAGPAHRRARRAAASAAGGRVECGARVERVLVRRGRAVGVRTADGREVARRRAVLADVGAPQLYLELLEREHVPARVLRGARGASSTTTATVKVDWALDGPIPWTAPEVARAGTVHVAERHRRARRAQAAELARGLVPARPFLVLGQYAHFDPTRQPAGKETAWAYTHVPQRVARDAGPDGLGGRWDRGRDRAIADRIEAQSRRSRPASARGIRSATSPAPPSSRRRTRTSSAARSTAAPRSCTSSSCFRPVPGLGRPETPVRGLYLASASAHPGGGVHGAPRRQRRAGGAGARAHQALMAQPKVTFWDSRGRSSPSTRSPARTGRGPGRR